MFFLRRAAIVSLLANFILVSMRAPAFAADDLEAGVKEISQQLASAMGGGKVKKLAVVEFPDLNGYQSSLGQFIAEELITQLSTGANAGQFDVVERRQLTRVLQEQELTDSSLFDAGSISKIGKILGIDTIVTGSIADLGTDIKINARAISVETAKVFAAAAAKVPRNDTVLGLMRQNAGVASESIGSMTQGKSPISARPVQRAGVFFQNGFLRIDVNSITLSKDKKMAVLAVNFQNITQRDIFIAVEGAPYTNDCNATLIDNAGTVVPVGSDGGVLVTGIKCAGFDYPKEYFVQLQPGIKTPVIFTFVAKNQNAFAGNVFSFSVGMLDLFEEHPRRFTVGISDIDLLR
jgi:TolB-like protein